MWPSDSTDTVCPCPPRMTQVQHFVSRIKKRQRWYAQMDVSLWPWPLTLEVMASVVDAGRRPPSVYQVWSLYALPFGRYGARCMSALMDVVTLNLWPFDLKTGVRIVSKVRNLPSKFGHARPLGSRIIRYVRDLHVNRQTDNREWTDNGRTDKSNAYCHLPYGGRGIIMSTVSFTC